MAYTLVQFYINDWWLVQFLHREIVVVVCASPFRSSDFSGFGDVYPGSCDRGHAVHLHLVLAAGLDLFFAA